jgi:methylase of polypeptide subunit release factors
MTKKVRANQKIFLKSLLAKKEPYIEFVNKVPVTIFPGVFPPATDTRLLAKHIRITPKCNKVLDLTTGSGSLALIAGLQGATGLACDINPLAVKNANFNFNKNKVKLKAIKSDLYKRVPKGKYDLVIANGPYIEGDIKHPLEYAFFGASKFLSSLFKDLNKYLKPEGVLLITIAEWGDVGFFNSQVKEYGYKAEILGRMTSKDGERKYRLYRISF